MRTLSRDQKPPGKVEIAQTNNQLPAGLQTAREVAAQANYRSPVSVLRAFRRGDLPGYKLGLRTVRFAEKDVRAWIAAARVSGKAGAKKEAQ
jgi:predicted DNA-binding transcriptional regulator AlpA